MAISTQSTFNPNRDLFESVYQEIWRKLIPPGLTEAEADFIEEITEIKPGSSLLDMMCGYGRHSFELAKRGYNVTAIDSLPAYIKEIQERAEKENLPVKGILTDVAATSFPGVYSAVICMGNSFAGFNRENAANVLQNIAKSLQQGSVFMLNSWMIGEIAIKHFKEKSWQYVEGYKYLLDDKYLFHPTRIETDHILIAEDGTTTVLKGVDYIFTFAEIEALLQDAGFEMKEVYSTPRKRKYQFGDNRAYIVAVKK